VISSIQHECIGSPVVRCVEYGWDLGNLVLKIED